MRRRSGSTPQVRTHTAQQLERGGLARAVGACVGHEFAPADGQIDAVERVDFGVGGVQQVAQQAVAALLLAEGFADTAQLNCGVPLGYIVSSCIFHKAIQSFLE